MVTFHVLGSGGMLGSTVARRWREHGAQEVGICTADRIVNCVYPDSYPLLEALPKRRVIQPSTDAIWESSPYAATKREVERLVVNEGGLVIRTGLVDLRRQPAVAYTNWIVNPLTPLEWADLAWELQANAGIHPDGRGATSRYGVALAVAREWNLAEPDAAEAPEPLVRLQPASRHWPSLAGALHEYRVWLG